LVYGYRRSWFYRFVFGLDPMSLNANVKGGSKQGSTSKLYKVKKGVAIKGGSGSNIELTMVQNQKLDLDDESDRLGHTRVKNAARSRVSIKNAETVNNPLVNLSGSTLGEGEDKIVATPSKQDNTFLSKVQKRWSDRTSGNKDLQQNITLAINAAQLFYLVVASVEPLLPRLYLDIVLRLAFFSFNLSLTFPSLRQDELEWYQLLCNVSVTAMCCWFLCRADGSKEENKEEWELLPWQKRLHELLLHDGCSPTVCLVTTALCGSGLGAVGTTCLGNSRSALATACVVLGAYITTTALTALAARAWLRFELKLMETMFASLTKGPSSEEDKTKTKWDEHQPDKHFWARTTLEMAGLAILLLNAIFLPMVQAVVDAVDDLANGHLTFLRLCEVGLLLPCALVVVAVFSIRLTGASKTFKLAKLDKESHANTDVTQTIAYDKTIAAKFTKASTHIITSRVRLDGHSEKSGDGRSIDPHGPRRIPEAALGFPVPLPLCQPGYHGREGGLGPRCTVAWRRATCTVRHHRHRAALLRGNRGVPHIYPALARAVRALLHVSRIPHGSNTRTSLHQRARGQLHPCYGVCCGGNLLPVCFQSNGYCPEDLQQDAPTMGDWAREEIPATRGHIGARRREVVDVEDKGGHSVESLRYPGDVTGAV
jgi:hypothetical protein